MVRDGLDVHVHKRELTFTSFELLDLSVSLRPQSLRLLVIYRPPSSSKAGATFSKFLAEFADLLETVLFSAGRFIILGDFNIHVDNKSCSDAQHFLDLTDSLNLTQHVQVPTHIKGHTLDLVLTRTFEIPSLKLQVLDTPPSDHHLLCFDTDLAKPAPAKITRSSRSYREITGSALASFLESPVPTPGWSFSE